MVDVDGFPNEQLFIQLKGDDNNVPDVFKKLLMLPRKTQLDNICVF